MIKSLDLRARLAGDSAENSIMQTITIAVSAILIAAGLVTAPGLINNARDNNAKTDLANIAYAQEFHLGNVGVYADNVAALEAAAFDGAPVITRSGDVLVALEGTDSTYTIYAVSASGKVFERSNGSAAVTESTDAVVTGTSLDVDGDPLTTDDVFTLS